MSKKITNKFIPVYKFAAEKGIPKQTIYRWIREGKIKPEDFMVETKTVQRILIKSDYSLPPKTTILTS